MAIIPALPIFLGRELANALRHNPKFTKRDVKSALESLFNMSLEIREPDDSVVANAVDIAFEVRVNDSYFMALCILEKVPFVTADYRFIDRIISFSGIVKLSEIFVSPIKACL